MTSEQGKTANSTKPSSSRELPLGGRVAIPAEALTDQELNLIAGARVVTDRPYQLADIPDGDAAR